MTDNNLTDGTDRNHVIEPTRLTYTIGGDERPCEAVVRAVAKHTETGILELEPLYHSIDPEYLNGIFEKIDDGGNAEISFQYYGSTVTVTQEFVRVTARTETS